MENNGVREGTLVGVGIPLVDILVRVDESFLEKYKLPKDGSAQLDNATFERLLEDLEYMKGSQVKLGGSLNNTFRIAQRLLGIPKACTVFGCVGKDKFGDITREVLAEEKLNCQLKIHQELATGVCACLINGSNRMLCSRFAAAKEFSKGDLLAQEMWQHIEKASVLYLLGYSLIAKPAVAQVLVDHTRKKNKILCFSLSAPYVCEGRAEEIKSMLPMIDVLFGNEEELQVLTKQIFPESTEGSLHDSILRIAQHRKANETRKRVVAITRGSRSTLLAVGDGLHEYSVVPVPEDDIVDTCGAGDAFVGGFLSEFVRGSPVVDCVEKGHYAASLVIQQIGVEISSIPPAEVT